MEKTELKLNAGTIERPIGAQLGKRYMCGRCGTEVLCIKAGTGTLECCGEPMELKEAKPLPSSD